MTGGYCDSHLKFLLGALACVCVPNPVFICLLQESTYGTHIHENREEREHRFTGLVHDIVNRGGRCLIPVFALGRAQELLLILGLSVMLVAMFHGNRPRVQKKKKKA